MSYFLEAPMPVLLTSCNSSVAFTRLELDAFEREILANPKSTEQEASRFFARFPKFLFLGRGAELRRESVLVGPDGEPAGRVDFFRRDLGSKYWDIIELKHPHLKIMAGTSSNHPHLASKAIAAIDQAQDYRDWISESRQMRQQLLSKGLQVYRPKLIVIAGTRGTDVKEEVFRTLVDRIHRTGIEFKTYDELHAFASEHYEKRGLITMPANFEELLGASHYQGRYRYRMDGKLLTLPPAWPREEEYTFVIWPKWSVGTCIRILPATVMAAVLQNIASMPNNDPNKPILKSLIGGNSAQVRVDNLGRVLIPEEMLQDAGIEQDAIVSGLVDRFEIWNPIRYQQLQAANQVALMKMLETKAIKRILGEDQDEA